MISEKTKCERVNALLADRYDIMLDNDKKLSLMGQDIDNYYSYTREFPDIIIKHHLLEYSKDGSYSDGLENLMIAEKSDCPEAIFSMFLTRQMAEHLNAGIIPKHEWYDESINQRLKKFQ